MLELLPHQEVALRHLDDGCILWGQTGCGKSRVAVAYYQKWHGSKDVVVITTAKKRDSLDWEHEFARIAVSKTPEVCTENPIPHTYYGNLDVDSWNNMEKYVDRKNCFFIFDEQRLVGSGTWVKTFLKIAKNNDWIMLTATPGDTWLDYIPVFIANGFYKNRTQFKAEHVRYAPFAKFPKVIGYNGEKKLEKLRNSILVPIKFSSQTFRHTMNLTMEYNEDLYDSVLKNRWNIYKDKPIRDISELYLVLRQIVNSDPSRLKKVRELLTIHPKVIIFYNFNYELDILRRLSDVCEVAEWNGWKHEELPISEKWAYLVQYVAGSEGWNCVETDTIIFYSLTYSYKLWSQAGGRVDRMNTPFTDLYYYVLKSKSGMDRAVWRSLIAKESFQPARTPIEAVAKNVTIAKI